MSHRLHILEIPQLHGKPADSPLVHVVWEPNEYSSCVLDGPRLIIRKYTGNSSVKYGCDPSLPSSYLFEEMTACILQPGTYMKAWLEEVEEATETEFPSVDSPSPGDATAEVDPVYARVQPGYDGFSEDPAAITGEVEVVKVDDPTVEPRDQQTQIIQPVDPMKVSVNVIDVSETKPIQSLRQEPRKLDWGTMAIPLATPAAESFFNGDHEEVDSTKE